MDFGERCECPSQGRIRLGPARVGRTWAQTWRAKMYPPAPPRCLGGRQVWIDKDLRRRPWRLQAKSDFECRARARLHQGLISRSWDNPLLQSAHLPWHQTIPTIDSPACSGPPSRPLHLSSNMSRNPRAYELARRLIGQCTTLSAEGQSTLKQPALRASAKRTNPFASQLSVPLAPSVSNACRYRRNQQM